MPAFSRVTTWSSGQVLTAAALNAEFDNIISNFTLSNLDDYSANVSQMQETQDPGSLGSESLAVSLSGELKRLRYMFKAIHGGAQWYASALGSWITTAMLGDDQVTEAKILDGSVTVDKIADGSVTTPKLAVGALTYSNLPAPNKAYCGFLSNWSNTNTAMGTYTISSISRTSNVISVTYTTNPTTVKVGQIITLTGMTTSDYNGSFLCIANDGVSRIRLYAPGVNGTCTVGGGSIVLGSTWVPTDVLFTYTVNTITRASNVVTMVVTGAPCYVKPGQLICVQNTLGAATNFDGLYKVLTNSSGTITFAQTGPNESGTPATGTMVPLMGVSHTATGTRPVFVGIDKGQWYVAQNNTGQYIEVSICRLDLADGSVDYVGTIPDDVGSSITKSIIGANITLTPNPATPFVANSSAGGVTHALSYSTALGLYTPANMFGIDFVPTAATHLYLAVVTVSSFTVTTSTLTQSRLMAYEL